MDHASSAEQFASKHKHNMGWQDQPSTLSVQLPQTDSLMACLPIVSYEITLCEPSDAILLYTVSAQRSSRLADACCTET
jgi:hypothetical protein